MKNANIDNPQDKRKRLIEAALLVFADKGFDGAGIRDIALKARANSALVQYHFGGKQGLYVEALRFAFEQGPKRILNLPTPPQPQDADARAVALQCFKSYLREFLREFLECHGSGEFLPPHVERAAMILWNREMQYPRRGVVDFILGSIQPYIDYLERCMKVLRPDLDREGLFLMSTSIHGQLLYIHNHMELIGLLRGKAYTAKDLDVLGKHFIDFSLRGMNVPDQDFDSNGVES